MDEKLIYEEETYAIRRATGLKLGLLVNFCSYPKVEIRRIVV